MRLTRMRRSRHPETILALVDVVFFLLVFFLLIGRMDATAPFEVTPAHAVSGDTMPGGGATVAIAPDGRLALDGREASTDEIVAAVGDRVSREPDLLVRLNAHRDAALRFVMPLAGRLRAAGARGVVLVVTPEARPP